MTGAPCRWCGGSKHGRKGAIYCSFACRKKAQKQRAKGKPRKEAALAERDDKFVALLRAEQEKAGQGRSGGRGP